MADSKKKLQGFVSFNSGEYSPRLAGRVDLDAYASSARLISNFMVDDTGGIKKFYGTYHITELPKSEKFLMVPFANTYEPMCLVLSEFGIGVITTDTYNDLGMPPLGASDFGKLCWKQINDRLLFVAPDMPMASFNFLGPNDSGGYNFELEQIEYTEVPYFPVGWSGNYNGEFEVTGYNGTITIKIPDSSNGVEIDLPDSLKDAAKMNVLGYNNYLLANPGYVVGECTATLYKVKDGQRTKVLEGVVSGGLVGSSQS